MGVWMLAGLALANVYSGLPIWALLLGVSSLSAGAGVVCGAIELQVLGAMPARVMGVLESDILQALPLYVFIGLLLQRLAIAQNLQAVFARGCAAALGNAGSGYSLSVLLVGTVIAPMNGSVASSASTLTALVSAQVNRASPAKIAAWVSIASTIGVVVPPSLVLILLGDGMMRAHTEAVNLPGSALEAVQIINTQDVFNAALLPAFVSLALWACAVCWQGRTTQVVLPHVTKRQGGTALAVMAIVIGLLWAVFAGRIFAVEAAASACVLLVFMSVISRALSASQWRDLLVQSLAMSGALLALLVGATVFSLVFRLWGTDAWLTHAMSQSTLPPAFTAALILVGVALCSGVLDAIEMIFVVIPIVGPPLIGVLGDAQQAAVLLLLVLQLGFLLPPLGYAVMMARTAIAPDVGSRALLTALRPFLLAQLAVILLVFASPSIVHLLDKAESTEILETDAELVRRMQDMAQPSQ